MVYPRVHKSRTLPIFGAVKQFDMKNLTVAVALCLSILCSAQPKLAFRADSTFKVLQLTDTHLNVGSEANCEYSERTLRRIGELLSMEKPDLVMMTGDIVTWGKADGLWHRVVDTLDAHQVPYCMCFGNHDAECPLSRRQIADILRSSKWSLVGTDRNGEVADSRIDVLGHDGKPAFSFWNLDSHDYPKDRSLGTYAWFTFDQVDWFRKEAAAVTKKNGGTPVPSFMFFHIPVPEYDFVGHRHDVGCVGRKGEDECIQSLNTGMFAAAVESGSVIGMTVGHDHDNDYVLLRSGLALCYGRFSGDDTIYNHVVRGARVFVFREGSRSFETWIREETGREVEHVRVADGKFVK